MSVYQRDHRGSGGSGTRSRSGSRVRFSITEEEKENDAHDPQPTPQTPTTPHDSRYVEEMEHDRAGAQPSMLGVNNIPASPQAAYFDPYTERRASDESAGSSSRPRGSNDTSATLNEDGHRDFPSNPFIPAHRPAPPPRPTLRRRFSSRSDTYAKDIDPSTLEQQLDRPPRTSLWNHIRDYCGVRPRAASVVSSEGYPRSRANSFDSEYPARALRPSNLRRDSGVSVYTNNDDLDDEDPRITGEKPNRLLQKNMADERGECGITKTIKEDC